MVGLISCQTVGTRLAGSEQQVLFFDYADFRWFNAAACKTIVGWRRTLSVTHLLGREPPAESGRGAPPCCTLRQCLCVCVWEGFLVGQVLAICSCRESRGGVLLPSLPRKRSARFCLSLTHTQRHNNCVKIDACSSVRCRCAAASPGARAHRKYSCSTNLYMVL